jgi:outer membrane biosynthesis protein TonB
MPDLPDLPDLPLELLSDDRPAPGFSVGPAALGQGIYAALIGVLLYLVCAFGLTEKGHPPSFLAIAVMGAAAFFGLPAVLLGLLEALKGGELRKQVSGGVAVAVGALLLIGAGGGTWSALSDLAAGDSQVAKGQREEDGEGTAARRPAADSGAPDRPGSSQGRSPSIRKPSKPEARPGPKPGAAPKPEPKPEPGAQSKPKPEPKAEPKPKPKPKPSPAVSRRLASQRMRSLMLRLVPAAARSVRQSHPRMKALDALRPKNLRRIDIDVQGDRANGQVRTLSKKGFQDFTFGAEKNAGKWKITSLALPALKLEARLSADGSWKCTQAAEPSKTPDGDPAKPRGTP